jgi:hypothetical protein
MARVTPEVRDLMTELQVRILSEFSNKDDPRYRAFLAAHPLLAAAAEERVASRLSEQKTH